MKSKILEKSPLVLWLKEEQIHCNPKLKTLFRRWGEFTLPSINGWIVGQQNVCSPNRWHQCPENYIEILNCAKFYSHEMCELQFTSINSRKNHQIQKSIKPYENIVTRTFKPAKIKSLKLLDLQSCIRHYVLTLPLFLTLIQHYHIFTGFNAKTKCNP